MTTAWGVFWVLNRRNAATWSEPNKSSPRSSSATTHRPPRPRRPASTRRAPRSALRPVPRPPFPSFASSSEAALAVPRAPRQRRRRRTPGSTGGAFRAARGERRPLRPRTRPRARILGKKVGTLDVRCWLQSEGVLSHARHTRPCRKSDKWADARFDLGTGACVARCCPPPPQR